MIELRRGRWLVSGIVLLGTGIGAETGRGGEEGPPALEGPVARGELLPETPSDAVALRQVEGPLHEAFLGADANPGRVRAPKSPPPPIVERPNEDRPSPEAQWVAGYWTWPASGGDFAWVAGAWRVPPRDMIWVNGRWQRDAEGWSRVPGFWSPRQARTADRGPERTDVPAAPSAPVADWKTTGPPADHPADEPGPAPDADAFYVPGHYTPDGPRVAWTPGFWSRAQPGWDWVPARWVRRPDGWDYREGSWVRDQPGASAPVRHTVARPRDEATGLPPAIVDSEPAREGEVPASTADRKPSRSDPIADAEDADAARDPTTAPAPVVVVPGAVPYPGPYVVPPYGYYYYGRPSPRANVPWGVLPPFARRVLNRVLP